MRHLKPDDEAEAYKMASKIENLVRAAYNDQLSWSETAFAASLLNEQHYHYIMTDIDTNTHWLAYAQFQLLADEAELFNLAVIPRCQGQRLGKQLLQGALNQLQALGMKRCILEVRASNIKARQLYESSDFAQIAVRKNYYQKQQEDAIIYLWKRE